MTIYAELFEKKRLFGDLFKKTALILKTALIYSLNFYQGVAWITDRL